MSRWRAIVFLLALTTAAAGGAGCKKEAPPPTSPSPGVGQYQGLSKEERHTFYHRSIGTQFIPYDWFVALRNYSLIVPGKDGKPQVLKGYGEPFVTTVRYYGLIPDPDHEDQLPVGMTKADIADFKTMAKLDPPRVGFNCAFCHTGEFTYQGKSIRIEGGVSLHFNIRFLFAVLKSLGETLKDNEKFVSFAKEVLRRQGKPINPESMQELAGRVKQELLRLQTLGRPDPLEWGFGRLDALGRGGNLVFSKLDPDNLRYANAPVKMTQIWGAWQYDWVQWNGSIRHPLARNVGQVIGVGADLFTNPADHLTPQIDPQDPFRSSVDSEGIKTVEALVEKLSPPKWPSEFPPINHQKAKEGENLYATRCAHCHAPKLDLPKGVAPARHSVPVTMIPIRRIETDTGDEIGTDRGQAENFWNRRADTGPLKQGRITAAQGTELLTTEILRRAGNQVKEGENPWRDKICYSTGAAPQAQMPNEVCYLAYMARPHRAIWATAPYLHNGSVPTLYDLLSPWEERPKCFEIGPAFEFDPEKVGYKVGSCDLTKPSPNPLIVTDAFRFDTGRTGNSNRGHEFTNNDRTGRDISAEDCARLHTGNREGRKEKGEQPLGPEFQGIIGCGFSKDQRFALIEFLKTFEFAPSRGES